jgi:mRNA interferase RelE/StbE
MIYEIEFKPRAIKVLESLSKNTQRRIFGRIELLANDLAGDVKRLTNYTPEYRLRVGDHRILFEIEANKIVIYRVLHRKDAYR